MNENSLGLITSRCNSAFSLDLLIAHVLKLLDSKILKNSFSSNKMHSDDSILIT